MNLLRVAGDGCEVVLAFVFTSKISQFHVPKR